ncbi:site-specific integrase [Marinitenerispora sediminis]|uniref:Integrase n=1 Tax=Marinitenerispora sediminis TaxID=1931232 RepID=A0A368SZR6_9ACTN|nr:site-specific integrase [Marinitenerispora sediminis]RCV48033.1 integrase [Marinitenerispora sediminis]RCV49076.1 integrase [Marinitenerispora sediminis]RCV51172.1 integrase [Marinitenerispora sediminis]
MTSDEQTTETAEVLPAEVRTGLERVTHSVLVDTRALEAVRRRFDEEQASTLGRYLSAAQSANTLRAYRSDWIAFTAWCLAERRRSLPADPVDVAVYLAAAADAVREGDPGRWALSPATLERKAAAIAAVHGANGLASPTRADVVRMTLRGIRRSRRAQPDRKRPVLLHTLEALLAERPAPGHPTGVARRRDALLLLTGFAGALRRSELAGLGFDDIAVESDPRTGEPLLVVRLAATKTDQEARHAQQVALPRGRRAGTCPVCAFADWADLVEAHRDGGAEGVRAFLAHDEEPAAARPHRCHRYAGTGLADGTGRPLFPSVSRHGAISARAMSGRAVAELVKRYAERAGLDPKAFSGHSLRSGFATQAALGGASDREIMRQGRWTNSRTVHGYIRTANPLEDNAVTRLGI